MGYTNDVVVGVWGGNNDGTFMIDGPGSSVAGPLWNDIITHIYTGKDSTPLPTYTAEPTGLGVLDGRVSALSNNTGYHPILYFIDKEDPRSGGDSLNDPQAALWEAGVTNWLQTTEEITPPVEGGDSADSIESGEISITLLSPPTISTKEKSVVEVSFVSENPLHTISVSLGSLVIFSNQFYIQNAPFIQSIAVPVFPSYIKSGLPFLQVEARDIFGNKQSSRFPLTVVSY